MKYRGEFWIVIAFVVLAFVLRVHKLPTDLLYHRDQGLVAMDIYRQWHDGDISLIGAPSDVDGIVHSATYYWILLPFYALSGGNIVAPAIFQILIECLSLPFLYMAVKRVFNKKTGILALMIYTVSYGMISYSKWFITVPFILPLTNSLFYLLVLQYQQQKKSLYIFLTSLLVGMIVQTNAAVGVFIIPFLLYFYRKDFKWRSVILLLSGLLLPALPLVVFQFRNEFVTLKAIYNYAFHNQEAGVGFGFEIFNINFNTFLREVNHTFLYPFYLLSTFVFFISLYMLRKNKYRNMIYAYLIIPFLFLSLFQRGAISFFFISALPIVIAVVSYGIGRLQVLLRFIVIVSVMLLNIFHLQYIYRPTNALIPIGNSNLITLQDRKNVIDWIYQQAGGKQFSVWIYTIPYFQDYPWEYLFITYGNDKYGYQPEGTKDFSPGDLMSSELFFNVYELEYDNSSRQVNWFNEVFANYGEIVNTYSSNDVHVELRSWHGNQE